MTFGRILSGANDAMRGINKLYAWQSYVIIIIINTQGQIMRINFILGKIV